MNDIDKNLYIFLVTWSLILKFFSSSAPLYTRVINMSVKKAIAGLKKAQGLASLKEKLAQMQEKAEAQNRQPDMEKANKKKQKAKEAVI